MSASHLRRLQHKLRENNVSVPSEPAKEESMDQDMLVAAAIKGMKAEMMATVAGAEAAKKEAEEAVVSYRQDCEKMQQMMTTMPKEMREHMEAMMTKMAKEYDKMMVAHRNELDAMRVRLDALHSQLAETLERAAKAEAERDTIKKVHAAMEKKTAAKPAPQPVIMPAAKPEVPPYYDFIVTQRDMNGRIAGGRFTPGKS